MVNKIFFLITCVLFFVSVCFGATISGTHQEAGVDAEGSVVYALDFGTNNTYQYDFATTTTDASGNWSITDAGFVSGETIQVIIADPDEVYQSVTGEITIP